MEKKSHLHYNSDLTNAYYYFFASSYNHDCIVH